MEKLTRYVRPAALFQEVEPIIAALCASSRLCSRLLEKVAAGYYFTLEPSPFSVFDRFPFPSPSSVFRFSVPSTNPFSLEFFLIASFFAARLDSPLSTTKRKSFNFADQLSSDLEPCFFASNFLQFQPFHPARMIMHEGEKK